MCLENMGQWASVHLRGSLPLPESPHPGPGGVLLRGWSTAPGSAGSSLSTSPQKISTARSHFVGHSAPTPTAESASSCCCFQLWLRLPHHDLTPTLYSWSCSQLLIIKEQYSSSSCTRTCAEQGLWGHDDSRANSAWGLTVFLLRWSHASKWGWSNCFCALQTHRSCLTNYHRCLSNCQEV